MPRGRGTRDEGAGAPDPENLIERDRRPLTGALLLRLAESFDIDLRAFAPRENDQLVADLHEVFADALFEDYPVPQAEVREAVAAAPDLARAVVRLHHAWREAKDTAQAVTERVLEDQDLGGIDRARLSSEQVSEFIQRHQNHFPELEAEAEALQREAKLETEFLYSGLTRHLKDAYGVAVRLTQVQDMDGAVRRFDPRTRELRISEVLMRGSRTFHLATQIGLLRLGPLLNRLTNDPLLPTAEARTLCRMALANYFAGAVLMPYDEFLEAAEAERYDLELLGHRFRVGFEQVCHRLTSLRRPGREGVDFYFVRVDIAGNISKKFSSAGIRFPRFAGLCGLWNVHRAFLQPGRIRTQVSRMPDGQAVFALARTVQRHPGGWHDPEVLYAVGIGCDIESARRLVYADGMDLERTESAVPIGITCRSCPRLSCAARAFPAVSAPLRVDENVRGVSFFAPAEG